MKRITDLSTLEWFIVGVVVFAAVVILIAIFLPPPGEIHDSVKDCLWIMLAFDGILAVVFAVHKGVDAKFSHGNTTVEMSQNKK